MPKDMTKNVDRYKVRGGQLNEYDFHQNQENYAEKQASNPVKAKKKSATKKAPAGASAKKLAARKAAKKK